MIQGIGELILNINDDESSRYAVTRILQREGFAVVEANSGKSGIEAAKTHQPNLIVLDIQLPDMSGFEVCRVLKTDEGTTTIPVLHLTAHALSTEHKIQSLKEGAEAYLTFPLEPSFFVATIRSLLRLRKAEQDRQNLLEREKAEKLKLTQALSELEAERLIKEQFIATLTHDLRSPLTAIRMSAQILMRKPESADVLLKQCGRILNNVTRADRMIQDLLDSSLIRMGQKLPIQLRQGDLLEFVQETLDEFTSAYGDRFVLDGVDEPLMASFDPSYLRRALENLINNGIKYGAADAPITVALKQIGDHAEVQVRNLGSVVPEESRKTLFDPFHRADEAKESGKPGWGLGLALVRGVMDAHSGIADIASSSVEEGTVFRMKFPLRPKADLRLTGSDFAATGS